jgi:TRAP-type mannitol/chloroaromatic compound transport system substrate-binding protein
MYLSRWQNEASWTQTSQADFNSDTLTNISVTNTSGGEVQLAPGQTSGSVVSTTFDAGSSVGFNYLNFTDTTPTGTSVQFQIASNNDNSTWNYVGPDGTNTTFYTSPGAIPLSAINGRYIRYQVNLTGSGGSTPVIDDVTLTYSP